MRDSAFESFSEAALDVLDFARCQRPDGSYYGTAGQCRKGAPVGAKEKAEKKTKEGFSKKELRKASEAKIRQLTDAMSLQDPLRKDLMAELDRRDEALTKADALVEKLQEGQTGRLDMFDNAQDALVGVATDIEDGYDTDKFAPNVQGFIQPLKDNMEEGMSPEEAGEAVMQMYVTNNGFAGVKDSYSLATYGRDMMDDVATVEKAYRSAGLSKKEAEEKGSDFYDSFIN